MDAEKKSRSFQDTSMTLSGLLEEILKDYPGDMLLVTHSRDEAFRFCDQLILFRIKIL